jgi:hypothetical protein
MAAPFNDNCATADQHHAHPARVVLQVQIDLDAIPGANHYGEDTQNYVQYLLKSNIPHYNPVVTMIRNDRPLNVDEEYNRLTAGDNSDRF